MGFRTNKVIPQSWYKVVNYLKEISVEELSEFQRNSDENHFTAFEKKSNLGILIWNTCLLI